tara:strand:- start:8240 stop:8644 length:405 start_codon:yes stop_codon:yes gene_type:complete
MKIKNETEILANICKHLRDQITVGEGKIVKFRAKLDDEKKGMAHAFEWSQDAFAGSASIAVSQRLLNHIHNGGDNVTVGAIKLMVQAQVSKAAMYFPQSSSVTSNLMDQFRGRVWAETLEYIEHCIEWNERVSA